MDLDELEATNGGRQQNKSCCSPPLLPLPPEQKLSPEKSTQRVLTSHDGHLGGVEDRRDYIDEWERWADQLNIADPHRRNYYGFLLPDYFGE